MVLVQYVFHSNLYFIVISGIVIFNNYRSICNTKTWSRLVAGALQQSVSVRGKYNCMLSRFVILQNKGQKLVIGGITGLTLMNLREGTSEYLLKSLNRKSQKEEKSPLPAYVAIYTSFRFPLSLSHVCKYLSNKLGIKMSP